MADRYNILISRAMDDLRTADGRFTGLYLTVRWGYTPVEDCPDRMIEGRPASIPVQCRTMFDSTAINNLGLPGASVVYVNPLGVNLALAELRHAWGDIPVQDNSGRFPELATAPGVLNI
jgi:hypothetical protein